VIAPVLIQVPGSPEYVSTIRAVTRSVCALADLAADDVEELQIAVDEAATLLLPLIDAAGHGRLEARFTVESGHLGVTLCVQTASSGADVDRSGMAWIMLTGLDPDVRVDRDGSDLSITIRRARSHAVQ
jgi:serine/threonine-protein kinase RsbW